MMMRDIMSLVEAAGASLLHESAEVPSWPPVLKDRYAIADYIETVASAYVDNEYISEHFRGCRAVLRMVPLAQIREGDEDHNIPSKAKERRYAKMDIATMPPIVIEDGEIQDGHHRYRVAKAKGLTEMLCYVVEEIED